jgi:hypothetical protein
MSDYNAGTDNLPDDDEILKAMNHALDDNLIATQNWRQVEVRENYALFEGNQWTRDSADRQIANGMPTITINRTAPVIESICGFEVQNRLDINYSPRLTNDEQEGFSDVLNNTVEYIEQNAKAESQYSLAFKDMLLCGVGATNTTINYDSNPDGEVEIRRVFPAFVFWDITARAKNIVDANYIIEMKVLDTKTLVDEFDIEDFDDIYDVSTIDARILEFFETILAVETLGVVYEYQWRKKEDFYRCQNPFKGIQISDYPGLEGDALIALSVQLSTQYDFNPMLDNMFAVNDKSDLSDLKAMLREFDIKLRYTTQKKYCYYRAIITGGKVITKSKNYSQDGFSMKFMTGQFSELTQSYYGLLRGCRDPQRMLNQTVSDYVGFLQTIPKGGVNIEADAVSNLDAFIETYTKARNVTVFKPGALSSGKVMPKVSPPLPAGIMEMIQYADAQIMSVCGVTPELMGIMASKEMNSAFYRQQIQQGLTPLATYLDAKYTYLQSQARLYIDCVRILADNSQSRLVKNVTGQGDQQYFSLLKSNIAEEYDVVVEEVPSTPNENRETFEDLVQLQGQMASLPNPVNIMPLVMQYAPLKPDLIKQITSMMKPPPPPNPQLQQQQQQMQQQMFMADLNYKNAQSQKMMADAENSKAEGDLRQRDLPFVAAKKAAEIGYTRARTLSELHGAKQSAQESKQDILASKHAIVSDHMKNMNDHLNTLNSMNQPNPI